MPDAPAGRGLQGFLPAILSLGFLAMTLPLRYNGFGEADAPRLANDAILWRTTGAIPATSYLPRTSPAYLLALRLLLEAGLPPARLPWAMNLAAPFFGAGVILLASLLLQRLLPGGTWAWGAGALALSPAMFDESLYGMPHMPALLLFLAALLCLDLWTEAGRSYGWFAGAGVSLAGAAWMKADILLACGAFPALLLLRKAHAKHWAEAGPFLGACALWILAAPQLLHLEAPSAGRFAQGALAGTWKVHPRNLAQHHNRDIVRAFGVGASLAIGAGAFVVLRRDKRRLALFLAAWGLPPLLFWSMVNGNSARHVFAAFVPGCALAGLAIGTLPRRWIAAAGATALLANTFALRPEGTASSPSGRLFAYRCHRARSIERIHHAARESAREAVLGSPGRLVLGAWSLPYMMFETLAPARRGFLQGNAISLVKDVPDPGVAPLVVTRIGSLALRTRFVYVSSPDAALAQVRSEEAQDFPSPLRALSMEFAAPGIEVPGGSVLEAP